MVVGHCHSVGGWVGSAVELQSPCAFVICLTSVA